MRRVAIVGVGVTPRNRASMRGCDRRSWKRYVADAAYGAVGNCDRGFNPRDIQFVVCNMHGEAWIEAGGIGPIVSDVLGLHPVGVSIRHANCTGAGVSLHDAYGLVASGRYDRVLVIGFDKRWDLLNFGDKRAIGGDVDYDFMFGFDHPQLQGMLQAMYYQKFGRNSILRATVTARLQMFWYANRNPNAALFGQTCPIKSVDDMMRLIEDIPESEPIGQEWFSMLPGRASVEGASACLLVPADQAAAYSSRPVYIDGVAYKSNSHLLSKNMFYPVPELAQYDAADFGSSHLAVKAAYQMASIGPDDVDFAELYESHPTSLLPTLAATQVAENPIRFVLDGETAIDGRLPTGTDGGRSGFGVTSGSNFTDGVYEAVVQMRGEAGERQLRKADCAVIVGMQGEMASSAAAVLKRA
jgi:acetyl-CoA acetyltransferase